MDRGSPSCPVVSLEYEIYIGRGRRTSAEIVQKISIQIYSKSQEQEEMTLHTIDRDWLIVL